MKYFTYLVCLILLISCAEETPENLPIESLEPSTANETPAAHQKTIEQFTGEWYQMGMTMGKDAEMATIDRSTDYIDPFGYELHAYNEDGTYLVDMAGITSKGTYILDPAGMVNHTIADGSPDTHLHEILKLTDSEMITYWPKSDMTSLFVKKPQ